ASHNGAIAAAWPGYFGWSGPARPRGGPEQEGPMRSEGEGSITGWIGDLKAGGDAASQPLWERYFDRLVRHARAKLLSARRPGIVEDEEDAALSAFDSFCRGAAQGRFPRLGDRNDLWRLLVVITTRKVLDQFERRRAAKRGSGRLVGESALLR